MLTVLKKRPSQYDLFKNFSSGFSLLIGSFVFAFAAHVSADEKQNTLYYTTLRSDLVNLSQLTEQIEQLHVEQAGKMALGSTLRGKPYFHFYIPEQNAKTLIEKLSLFGRLKINGMPDHKTPRPGTLRFILWIDQTNEEVPDLFQSLASSKRKNSSRIKNIKSRDIASWILTNIKKGPIDFQTHQADAKQRQVFISSSRTPLNKFEDSTFLPVTLSPLQENCPAPPTEDSITSLKEFENFILSYSNCYILHFGWTNYTQKTARLKISLEPMDPLIQHAIRKSSQTNPAHPHSPVVESESKSAPASAPIEIPPVKTLRLHALGSLVNVEQSIAAIMDIGFHSTWNHIAVSARFAQTANAPTNNQFSSGFLSLGYTTFSVWGDTSKTLFPHVLYSSMTVQATTGSFYGAGLTYTDKQWPLFNSYLQKFSWLPQTMSAEASVELLPSSATSSTSKANIYSAQAQILLHQTQHLSLHLGSSYQSYSFTRGTSDINQQIFFAQAGLSYLF